MIKETEAHLQIIAKEIPKWVTFCEMYGRMAREWRSEFRGIVCR